VFEKVGRQWRIKGALQVGEIAQTLDVYEKQHEKRRDVYLIY